MKMLDKRWMIGCVLVAAISGSTGCSAVTASEERGSVQQKQLAPRAMIKTKASPQTRSAFGISEWRLYRGKRGVYLTGYDKAGKAVKGLSMAFVGSKKSAQLRTRIHDGSKYEARFAYGAKSVTAKTSLASKSDAFMKQAMADVGALRRFARNQSGATTLGQACGVDLMTILMTAMQCMQAQGNNPAAQQTCINAAMAAQASGQSCQGTGTVDPTGGGTTGTGPFDTPFDPNDPNGGFDPNDPNGGFDPNDPFGGFDPNDPNSGFDPNDPFGGFDPNDPNGGFDPNDPNGGFDPSDPFGDQSCSSCEGDYGDIYGDANTGDIDYNGGGDGWGDSGGYDDYGGGDYNGDYNGGGDYGGGDYGGGEY